MKNSEQKHINRDLVARHVARPTGHEVWAGWMKQGEADWPKYRVFFWLFAFAVITATVVLDAHPRARPSLFEQLVVFLGLSAFGSVLGFMLGYFNSRKKRPLAVANILWICIALWSVHATLSQVADHLDKSERELEQLSRDIAFADVVRTVAQAEHAFCDEPRLHPGTCEAVRTVQIELSLPLHAKNLYGIGKVMEKLTPALATRYPKLAQEWKAYTTSAALYAAGESARKTADHFIVLQYAYLLALILTFCFVMANAGAEWRRAKNAGARITGFRLARTRRGRQAATPKHARAARSSA